MARTFGSQGRGDRWRRSWLEGSTAAVVVSGIALFAACKTADDSAPNEAGASAELAVAVDPALPVDGGAGEGDAQVEAEAQATTSDAKRAESAQVVDVLSAPPPAKSLARPRLAGLPYGGTGSEFDDAGAGASMAYPALPSAEPSLDRYDAFGETGFVAVRDRPLSTFSIDVDTASYSNLRRFLAEGTKPPRGAVRIEEMLNYFRYPEARELARSDGPPIALESELFEAPWQREHRLVRVSIDARRMPAAELPPRNLVLLVDVSGSMDAPDRLPWVKRGLAELATNLRAQDRVAIVVYAGASGLVLEPTPGDRRGQILAALERLSAGGPTAGAEGIVLAYQVARRHFDPKGINRVVLATDGDFNVGVTNESDLVDLIEKERESGVFLSVLGFGRGNLNDAGMEKLADHGNGNYAYVDSPAEARRVLVHEAGATLVTLARDVKIQAEFNPAKVQAYRLIGYENRRLAERDFNDDTKDAGEIGAGHQLTALYEIVPVGVPFRTGVDPLKYEQPAPTPRGTNADEWLTLKLRYQPPSGGESRLVERVVKGRPKAWAEASESGRWTAAVALFGMLLQESEHRGDGSYALVRDLARGALGADERGERSEFVRLVALAEELRS